MDLHAAAFRIRSLTDCRLTRATVYVATHRAETDVPLIGGQVFFRGGMWRDRKLRLHFTAREDMFDRGFFAGFPPDLSLRARRLLYPIAVGPYLPRVRVNPLPYPSANVLRVGKALEELPAETELAAVLPDDLLERIAERAHAAGLAPPRVARDALRGEFADLLWTMLPRDQLDSPLLEETWTRRAIGATEQVRNAVELVRSGAPTLFFPEGRPSPDGSLGPLRAGLAMLVRRGKPDALRALAIAYDPVTCGRSYAYLALGEPFLPANDDIEEAVLTALRRTLPLTAGQVVASEVGRRCRRGARSPDDGRPRHRLRTRVRGCDGQGRPTSRPGGKPPGAARASPTRCGFSCAPVVARADGPRALVIDAGRVLADDRLRRAAREYAERPRSARILGQVLRLLVGLGMQLLLRGLPLSHLVVLRSEDARERRAQEDDPEDRHGDDDESVHGEHVRGPEVVGNVELLRADQGQVVEAAEPRRGRRDAESEVADALEQEVPAGGQVDPIGLADDHVHAEVAEPDRDRRPQHADERPARPEGAEALDEVRGPAPDPRVPARR